jgi:hypothetical protein
LLAKQGWRILKFPESLVARVMKGKYFTNGDFLSAKLGSRPSYAWRSIFQARGVVEDGVQWRVGNGANVRMWMISGSRLLIQLLFTPLTKGWMWMLRWVL